MHVLGSCEASAQYSPINFFVNLFLSKNSNLPDCFSDLIHTEYRKLHKNNGHSPFVSPSIMRSSVGQCRNIRFRQLSASHVIITSEHASQTSNSLFVVVTIIPLHRFRFWYYGSPDCVNREWVKCVTRTRYRVGKPALGFYKSLKNI